MIKMRKKGSVRKMPEPRGVVGHGVGRPRNVVVLRQVAVMALVHAGEA